MVQVLGHAKEYILLLIAGVALITTLVSQQQSQLQLVVVWTRHGARGPMYDVLQSYYSWWTFNYQPEELTAVGQRQQYILGAALRRNYRFFLPEYFNESVIQVHSTSSQRAVRSAQAFLMGMFPKAPKLKPNEFEHLEYSLPPGYNDNELMSQLKMLRNQKLPFNYQPFPMVSPLSNTDTIMSPENICPRVQQKKNLAFTEQQYLDWEKQLQSNGFYDEFSQVFFNSLVNKNILIDNLNMTVVGWYVDSLLCDKSENIALPDELTSNLMNQMQYVYDIQNLWKNYPDQEQIKLMASNAARSTLKHMTDYISNYTSQNVIVYSGHDGNLITMLQYLGLMTPTFDFADHEDPNSQTIHTNPPFGSSLIFELYNDLPQYQYSIRIIYNGQQQQLSFCQNPYECTLVEFQSYVMSNTFGTDEWNQACQYQYQSGDFKFQQ